MSDERARWLNTTQEKALDPALPICDPHHHLWDTPQSRYLLEELHEDTGAGHNVVQTVFLECSSAYREQGPEAMKPVGETDFVLALAEESERSPKATIAGIVGYADLRLGEAVEEVLDAHLEAGGGRFRGIRHASAWDAHEQVHNAHTHPSEDMFYTDEFRRGAAVLAHKGLSFDAWLYHPQIATLVDLARALPELPIVLDHLGGPLGVGPYAGRRDEVREAWRPPMRDLASCPNVVLKLGGIGMSIYGLAWHKRPTAPSSQDLVDAWGEDVRWCIELFGPERCMFESNFPVDKRGCSYTVLWNAFKRIAADYGEGETSDLFHNCAARFYRLDTV